MVSVVAGKLCFMISVVDLFYGFRRGKEHLFYGFRRWFSFMVSGCYRTAAVSPMDTVNKKHQDVSVTN